MSKVLSIMLCWIFTIFSSFLIWWITFAQENGNPGGDTPNPEPDVEVSSNTRIKFSDGCLTGMWNWCFDYEEMIMPGAQNPNMTATSIAQDVLLSATYMVGSVLTVVIIYCWLMYIFAARWWKDPKAYKDWLIKAAIWALLVRWAYTIVRLIQYISKW